MNNVSVARRSHKEETNCFGPAGMKHAPDTIGDVFQALSNGQHALTGYLTHFAVIEGERGSGRRNASQSRDILESRHIRWSPALKAVSASNVRGKGYWRLFRWTIADQTLWILKGFRSFVASNH